MADREKQPSIQDEGAMTKYLTQFSTSPYSYPKNDHKPVSGTTVIANCWHS